MVHRNHSDEDGLFLNQVHLQEPLQLRSIGEKLRPISAAIPAQYCVTPNETNLIYDDPSLLGEIGTA
jgi:hypothetical protein